MIEAVKSKIKKTTKKTVTFFIKQF